MYVIHKRSSTTGKPAGWVRSAEDDRRAAEIPCRASAERVAARLTLTDRDHLYSVVALNG